jgi:hypothetical protein
MTSEQRQLAEIVARIIDTRRKQIKINPSWIATEALNEIDPTSSSIGLVRAGCHMHLKQVARAQCRTLFEDGDDDAEPHFTGFENLQWRYPTAHSKENIEHEYVVLGSMTTEDVAYNVARLRSEANAKLAHADALEAWGRGRDAA